MNPKNTTLHTLDIFLAVAREKNFSEVARQYDVASSVISRQIKQLEDDFGQTLFYRNTRAMSLTQAGEQFAKHAHSMLSQFQSLNQELHRSNQESEIFISMLTPQSAYRPVNVQAVMDFFIEKLDGGKCWQVQY